VKRIARTGAEEHIDVQPPSQLPDLNALRTAYGPGNYRLLGRGASGRIVARAVQTVGAVSSAAAAAPEAVATGSQRMDPFLSSLLQANTSLATALATSSKESNATIVSAITQLAGSRLTDQKDLFHTLLKSKGGGSGKSELELFQAAKKEIFELLDAAREEGGGDDSSEEMDIKRIKAVAEAMREWRLMKNETTPPGNGNGSPAASS